MGGRCGETSSSSRTLPYLRLLELWTPTPERERFWTKKERGRTKRTLERAQHYDTKPSGTRLEKTPLLLHPTQKKNKRNKHPPDTRENVRDVCTLLQTANKNKKKGKTDDVQRFSDFVLLLLANTQYTTVHPPFLSHFLTFLLSLRSAWACRGLSRTWRIFPLDKVSLSPSFLPFSSRTLPNLWTLVDDITRRCVWVCMCVFGDCKKSNGANRKRKT